NLVDLALMQALANPNDATHYANVVDASLLPNLFKSIFTTIACPTISIAKSNDSNPNGVVPGTTVKYTLTLTVSNGPIDDVTIVDTLPTGIGTATSISNGGTYDSGTNKITWTNLDG